MIKERMLELLVLSEILTDVGNCNIDFSIRTFNGNQYDNDKLEQRYKCLIEEFLEPYALDSTSKE